MSEQRTTGTDVERALRSILHKSGLRYRVNRSPVRGLRRTADIVFGPAKVAVMVDGCFWHSCPVHATRPKANSKWWADKLAKNIERDRETDRLLTESGWLVLRVWEHEDLSKAAIRIQETVEERRAPSGMTLKRRQRTG